MPKFGSVFSTLQAKLEEARISDINYELGKLAQESKAYVTSWKPDSFGFWRRPQPPSSVPKSTSLPVFPHSGGTNNNKKGVIDSPPPCGGKYRYKSAATHRRPEDDQLGDVPEEGPVAAVADATVVERFIRVIEGSSSSALKECQLGCSTREEIRKKLAFTDNFDSLPRNSKKANTDLEVCFINEISEEEEDEEIKAQVAPQPISNTLARSQSEYISISSKVGEIPSTESAHVAFQLTQCQDIARRKILVEKRNRKFIETNAFNKLIGKSIEGPLTSEILTQMNLATIQVIVNRFHSKIEQLNEELVSELLTKDELQVM